MKLIHDSTPCLIQLLLLAKLFVHTSSHPTHSPSLCGMFKSMIHQVDMLTKLTKKLHELTDEELENFAAAENRLNFLPHISDDAASFTSRTVNESLSQLYVYTQSFRLHLNWLKTAKENVSLPSKSAENAASHLLHLSNIADKSLQQISEEVPETPSLSLPVVSTAFDTLQYSVEISQRLQVFCGWSKRVLLSLQRLSRCPRN